ncbi:RagB/SusD family nutrient uptake outer membrane protein [Pedobacter changchengzhani]|uniref:RagB/SusD family nutrient uptake outer membrane protein n=1 Tax=Pedobacter changchengzhani TaxID=2529274 RepID=A0A4R5MP08_9SPHI|nr:RagB/SusD family nutrient uptake outer membrane protein [Pedobacter changchengzhani]TDG37521.1 RagB/SusD family nutrient uptake outer membrane protein [Pedobacter changchengzhani]
MKKYLSLLIITLIAALQFGCKKQLDALPKDSLVEGNVITNEQTARTALNGVYYRFANASRTNTDWLKNEIYAGFLTGFMDNGYNSLDETENKLAKSYLIGQEWNTDYAIINSANGIIEGVSKANPSSFSANAQANIKAEAKFMRAWATYKLLSWYGQWWDINSSYGALLRDKFVTSTNVLQARASVKSSYDFILNDINYAIDSAVVSSSNVYVNKYTAMALKMRVLLNRGEAGDYPQVISLADNIIANSPYLLEPNLKDIFYTKGLSSKEVMLGVKPQAGQDKYYYNMGGYFVDPSYVATSALKSLLNNDPRQSWIIGPDGDGGKGFYFIKYVTSDLITTQTSEVSYAFRLTEVYLMKAEAIARSGGDLNAAKNILKNIMSHAGVTNFTTVDAAISPLDVQKQIYYEWIRNFVGEDDMNYWALLRFPLATVTQLRPTITTTEQYILPIPHSEFLNNPSIGKQNPGYPE